MDGYFQERLQIPAGNTWASLGHAVEVSNLITQHTLSRFVELALVCYGGVLDLGKCFLLWMMEPPWIER